MNERTAIVTGGSRGLGRALASELVRRGWCVIIDGRDREEVVGTAAEIGAVAVTGDVTDRAHRRDLVAVALRRTGRLDLLVNNAGTLGATPLPALADYPLDELRSTLETNVVAAIALTQEALPALRQTLGALMNVTSDAAQEAYPGWGGYGASKAALEQASRILAEEEPTVTVWWVDPGDMRTRMHQDAFPGEDISDRPDPQVVAPVLADLIDRGRSRPPSGRFRLSDLVVEGTR